MCAQFAKMPELYFNDTKVGTVPNSLEIKHKGDFEFNLKASLFYSEEKEQLLLQCIREKVCVSIGEIPIGAVQYVNYSFRFDDGFPICDIDLVCKLRMKFKR